MQTITVNITLSEDAEEINLLVHGGTYVHTGDQKKRENSTYIADYGMVDGAWKLKKKSLHNFVVEGYHSTTRRCEKISFYSRSY